MNYIKLRVVASGLTLFAGLIVSAAVNLLVVDDVTRAEETKNNIAATSAGHWWQPKASEKLQWQLQLQEDVVLIPGVDVYAVDSSASQESINAVKATGARLMCYISAGSAEQWRDDYKNFPAAVVGNAYDGWPGEWWLDTSKIELLAPIMRARMDKCKAKGFDVLDPDNINGFENETGFDITRMQSIRYIRWLADEAHRRGMAFSLKNSEALIPEVLGSVDMMQSESCFFYNNCMAVGMMTAADKPVFAVEYIENLDVDRFRDNACVTAGFYNLSMIYRDTLLKPDGPYLSCDQ